MATGWAWGKCGPDAGAQGCTGSLQYHTGSGGISGSCNLIFYTGSIPNILALTGNLNVSGTITALNYDVVNHTVTYFSSSGDSKFGDSLNDVHQFTGSIQQTGSGATTYFMDKVGIGTTTPNYMLDVTFSGGSGYIARFKNSNYYCAMIIDAGTSYDSRIYFQEDGTNKWELGNDENSQRFRLRNKDDKAFLYVTQEGVWTMSSSVTITDDLTVCNGTASIAHLSGCSPIQVHAPMQLQSGDALSFNGTTNTAKITNQGENLDINAPQSIVLSSGNNTVSSSANISASAYYSAESGYNVGPAGADLNIFYSSAMGGNLLLKANDGNLILENEATDKKIINRLGSTDSNTSFQIRDSAASTSLFAVAGDGTVVVTPTGILQISPAGVLSSSANISASSFWAEENIYVNGVPVSTAGGCCVFREIDASNAYSTSSISIGTAGDPEATLYVSSSNNEVAFRVDNDQSNTLGPALFITGSRAYDGGARQSVGIGTSTPRYALDVQGYMSVGRSGTAYIFNNNDEDTYIKFGGGGTPGLDGQQFVCGGKVMLTLDENGLDTVTTGETGTPTDFKVTTLDKDYALYVSGGTDRVGIGTATPKVALDTHYSGSTNPVKILGVGGLGPKEGGGDVVYYGTGSALSSGSVYYLNEDGGWAQAQATDVSMATGQLGIALGKNAAKDGMLIRGFANIDTFFEGTIKAGKVLYVSYLNRGFMSHIAPTGSGEILRLVGHATSGSSNVIYFNPEVGWLELV